MRVAILAPDAADPAELARLRALAARGAEVALLVPGEEGIGVREEGALRHIPIQGAQGRWNRRQLRRALTEWRPELVQIEADPWLAGAAAAAGIARRLGAALVLHADRPPPRLPWGARRHLAAVLDAATLLLATHDAVRTELGAYGAAPASELLPRRAVRPPGAVVRRTGEPPHLACMGRLVPPRGVDLLLAACAELHGAWRLTIVGSGPEQAELEAQTERLGLASRVTWLGARPPAERERFWHDVDLLVHPAREELHAFDRRALGVLEAMGAGVGVVATATGLVPELVADTGALLPPGDHDALRDTLQRLIGDPAERALLGSTARRRALAHLTGDALAGETLARWTGVLAAR